MATGSDLTTLLRLPLGKLAALCTICVALGGATFWAGWVTGRLERPGPRPESQPPPLLLQWGDVNGSCGHDFAQVDISGAWDPTRGPEPVVCQWRPQ